MNNQKPEELVISNKIKQNADNVVIEEFEQTWKQKVDETKASVMNTRVKLIAQDLLFGYTSPTIVDKYSQDWKIAESTIKMYCSAARKFIRESVELDADSIRVDIISKYNDLYLANRTDGNLSECKKILDSLVKLTQIAVTQVNHNDISIETIRLTEVLKDDIAKLEGQDTIEYIETE